MSIGLTHRQADVLRFVVGYTERFGITPAYNEMKPGIGCSSSGSIHRLLTCLEERGYIRRLPNRTRGIEVLRPVAIPRGPEGEPLFFVTAGG